MSNPKGDKTDLWIWIKNKKQKKPNTKKKVSLCISFKTHHLILNQLISISSQSQPPNELRLGEEDKWIGESGQIKLIMCLNTKFWQYKGIGKRVLGIAITTWFWARIKRIFGFNFKFWKKFETKDELSFVVGYISLEAKRSQGEDAYKNFLRACLAGNFFKKTNSGAYKIIFPLENLVMGPSCQIFSRFLAFLQWKQNWKTLTFCNVSGTFLISRFFFQTNIFL